MNVNTKRPALPWAPKREVKPYERKADNDNSDFYNSTAWRKLSRQQLKEEPMCECCRAAGRRRAAKLSDHTIPINVGGARLDQRNLMSLCAPCHDRKSGMERHRSPLIEATMVDGELLPKNREDIFSILND